MERISEDAIVDVIKERGSSDIPLMIIVTSEDPGCSYCIGTATEAEVFFKANKGKYQFLYASIEPWNNIGFAHWSGVVPKVRGLPSALLFARSQFMVANSPPVTEKLRQWYDDAYPVVLAENPGELNYPIREAIAQLRTARQLWYAQKEDISAFASVRVGPLFAWGTSEGETVSTQADADKLALDVCTQLAREKGIEESCQLLDTSG